MSDHTTAAESPPAAESGPQTSNGLQQPSSNPTDKTKNPQIVSVVGADATDEAEMMKRAKHYKKWNRRLKIFFCCLGYKKNKDSIADIASIFSEFFYADLGVPSSDLAAGFVLLSKYQAAQRNWIVKNHQLGIDQYLSNVPITADSKFLDISIASDSHLINDLIYYMNYSIAIFGWPLQMLDDPCMLCCIYPYLDFVPCCSRRSKAAASANKKKSNDSTQVQQKDDSVEQVQEKKHHHHQQSEPVTREPDHKVGELNEDSDMPVILEDNCCGCNFASVERRLRAHNYEIVYVSYKDGVNIVPFLVAADHSKQAIVVALRGSMSLSDMVTDLNGQVDKLPIDDCPDDWLCHRGISKAAMFIKTTLINEHLLDLAFNCRPDLNSQDYRLILCGHSLGAGVAAMLGVLLRKQYPTLLAYLYSPPGGMLSLPAVEYTKQFATGVILGNDCVPRLGVGQLERLRYQVLLTLKNSSKSSGRVIARALCPSNCVGNNEVDYDPEQSLNLLYGTEARAFDYNGYRVPFQMQPQMLYVPGRLVHIVKNQSFKAKTKRFFRSPTVYQAVWTENTTYDRVLISEGMFYDHFPTKLMEAMKMLFSKTLPFRKESSSSSSVQIQREQSSPPPPPTSTLKTSPILTEQASKETLDDPEQSGKEKIVIAYDDNNNTSGLEESDPNHANNNCELAKLPEVCRTEKLEESDSHHQDNIDHNREVSSCKTSVDMNGNLEIVADRNSC